MDKLETVAWCIQETRDKNPYPLDIFVGKTMDGKVGRHCHNVWNNCLDLLCRIMEDRFKERKSKLFQSKDIKGMLTDGLGGYYPDDSKIIESTGGKDGN